MSLAAYLDDVASSVRQSAPPVSTVIATLGEFHVSDSGAAHMWLHDGRSVCRGFLRASRAREILAGPRPARDDRVETDVSPEYSPQWGFRLLVSGLRVTGRTLNDADRGCSELERRGVLGLNRGLSVPPWIGAAAILAPSGAGLEDFNQTIAPMEKAGILRADRYLATFEGPNAVPSLLAAIRRVAEDQRSARRHDAVFMVRGGGVPSALSWLDDIEACEALARLPLPVFTGLGHERDSPLPDRVACRAFGTPSKAAQFLREACTRLPLQAAAASEALAAAARTLADRAGEAADRLLLRCAAGSPEAPLARGYAFLANASDGRPVRPAAGREAVLIAAGGRWRVTVHEEITTP